MIRALLLLVFAAVEPWQLRELPAPVLACPLTASSSCEGRAVTVLRASSAWCEGDDGQVAALGNNAGCFSGRGLLIEEARTNYFFNSLDMTSGWTPATANPPTVTRPTDSTSPFATISTTVNLIADDSATDSEGIQGQVDTSPPATADYTCSCYMKAGSDSTAFLRSTTGGGVGHGQTKDLTLTSSWARYSFTFNVSGSPTSVGCQIRHGNGAGTLNADTGDFYVAHCQLERGSFATSPIVTSTLALQRANASATVPGTSIIRNSGHVSFVFTPEWSTGGTSVSNRVLFAMVDGAGINGAYFYTQPAGDNVVLRVLDNAGVGWSIVQPRTWTANVPVLIAGRWTPPTAYLDVNGARLDTAAANVPRPTDHGGVIGLCNWPTGIDRCNGWIRNVELRP